MSQKLLMQLFVLFVPIGHESERSLGHIWRPNQTQINLTNSYTKMGPLYIETAVFPLNFAYCDWPRWKRENIWTFPVVTGPMDSKSWLALIGSILFLTLVMTRQWSYSTSCMATMVISVILSSGISGNVPKFSILFVIWMLCSIVLVNLYSGELTSRLIAPLEVDTISDVADLSKNGYTLIFPGEALKAYVKSFRVDPLKKLMESAEIFANSALFDNLALKHKKASVTMATSTKGPYRSK